MTLASAARLLALLLAPCLVLPAWGRPAAVQVGEQSTPNLPPPSGGEPSTSSIPSPPQTANNNQACPQCAKDAQGCSSCGSRLSSLLHRQRTCVHVHQKPICAPCGLKHYGYYPTCWRPWPFPTNYSHCPPPPPPAAFQPPWYEPGNPHPPKGDEALPPPQIAPDKKEEPNGDKKKDEDAKKKDDTEKKNGNEKKKDTDKSNPGQLQGRLLPPLSSYNLSGSGR